MMPLRVIPGPVAGSSLLSKELAVVTWTSSGLMSFNSFSHLPDLSPTQSYCNMRKYTQSWCSHARKISISPLKFWEVTVATLGAAEGTLWQPRCFHSRDGQGCTIRAWIHSSLLHHTCVAAGLQHPSIKQCASPKVSRALACQTHQGPLHWSRGQQRAGTEPLFQFGSI